MSTKMTNEELAERVGRLALAIECSTVQSISKETVHEDLRAILRELDALRREKEDT